MRLTGAASRTDLTGFVVDPIFFVVAIIFRWPRLYLSFTFDVCADTFSSWSEAAALESSCSCCPFCFSFLSAASCSSFCLLFGNILSGRFFLHLLFVWVLFDRRLGSYSCLRLLFCVGTFHFRFFLLISAAGHRSQFSNLSLPPSFLESTPDFVIPLILFLLGVSLRYRRPPFFYFWLHHLYVFVMGGFFAATKK